jgi:hypothetical protein
MNPLPNVHQAVLDDGTLEALLSDVAAFGKDIEAIPKTQARQEVKHASIPLDQAAVALRDRSITALQLRYSYEASRWCDTIVATNEGWRLTRIDLSEAMSLSSHQADEAPLS